MIHVVAGALCSSEAILRDVFRGPYMTAGAILAPHDAWLMIRGLRTLQVRMQRIAATTQQVLAFLENHPKVDEKAYKAALDRIPTPKKGYDPWGQMRPGEPAKTPNRPN